MDQQYYTVQELAKIFNVHLRTIYRWAKSNKIRYTRINKQYFFPKSDYENKNDKI